MAPFSTNRHTPGFNQRTSRAANLAFLIFFAMALILLLSCSFATSFLRNPTPTPSHTPKPSVTQAQVTFPPVTAMAATATFPPAMTPTAHATPYATLDRSLPPIGPFQPVTAFANLKGDRILQLVAFSPRTFGVVTDQAVAMFYGTAWLWYLPEIEGHMVGQDEAKRVWVANKDGSEIAAWDGASWTAYNAESGWKPISQYHQSSIGYDLLTDATGNVWLTTNHDIRRFDGERWSVFAPRDMRMDPPESEEVIQQFSLRSLQTIDEIWVASCHWLGPGPIGGGGLRRFDGRAWHADITPPTSGCILDMTEDNQGRIWVGVDHTLWRHNPATQNWTSYPPPPFADDGRLGFITDITSDSQGNLWVEFATCGGASCFTGSVRFHFANGAWTQIGGVDDSGYETHLAFDALGTPWLFRDDGIYRIVDKLPERVADLKAEAVTQDLEGNPWFVARYKGQWVMYALAKLR